MPIIEVPETSLPLSQGDILEGIALFVTRKSWESDGGVSQRTEHRHCLVVSRPCVAVHKPKVLVAAIEKYSNDPPNDFESFEEACEFHTSIRDGTTAPDQFYIGQLAGQAGSFCARLDSLHTIQIPTDQVERQTFVANRRIGRLSQDFARDLHLRILRAVASLGFDDFGWHSTPDLLTVVKFGQTDLANAEHKTKKLEAKLQTSEAQGAKHPSTIASLKKQVSEAKDQVNKLKAKLAPYEEELKRREQA